MTSREGSPELTLEATLDVFRGRSNEAEPLTTIEVATALGCVRRTAYNKLRQLSEEGTIRTKKVGAKARVWWLPPGSSTPSASSPGDPAIPEGWKDFVDEVPTAIQVFDAVGSLLEANKKARAFMGIGEDAPLDAYSLGDVDVYDEDGTFLPVEDRPFEVAVRTGEPVHNVVVSVEVADGTLRWFLSNVTPLLDDDGAVEYVVSASEEITDLKRRERALAESESRFREFAEHLDDAVWLTNADGTEIDYLNPEWEHIVGRPRTEMYDDPESLLEYVHPEDRDVVERGMRTVAERTDAQSVPSEFFISYRILHPDGRLRYVEDTAFPIVDEDGQLIRFAGLLRDRTEQYRRERELAAQRDELARLNRVNQVIRRVSRAVVSAETQTDIERELCEHLTAGDQYTMAIVAEFSPSYDSVTVREVAGDETGYVDAISEASRNEAFTTGPGVDAAETGRVQVTTDLTDLREIHLDTAARESGFEAMATIPLVYRDSIYGVLGLYARDASSFDEREQAVLAELGETVGHAINSIRRREALVSDRVLELEFRSDALARPFLEASSDGDASLDPRLRMDRAVLLEDGTSVN
jgi:PAS domain S-box-containing protein